MILVMTEDYDVMKAANETPKSRGWGQVVKWREMGYETTIKSIGKDEESGDSGKS